MMISQQFAKQAQPSMSPSRKISACGRSLCCLAFVFGMLQSQAAAIGAEIKGKVAEATEKTVRIVTDSDLLPNIGDKVEIYFEIPGLDDAVQVGTGLVTAVDANSITATIGETKTQLTRNQLARVTSASPRKRSELVPQPVMPADAAKQPTPQVPVAPPVPAAKVGEVLTLRSDAAGITGLAFSADGRQAFSCSNALRVWDLQTGQPTRQFPVEPSTSCAAISSDRRRLVTGAANGGVRLWDIETGSELRRFTGHTTQILGVAFSRDGRFAATCAGAIEFPEPPLGRPGRRSAASPRPQRNDCTVRVWELETGREVRRLDGHKSPVMSVTFSPNGLYVLSASADRSIRLWDLRNGKEMQRLLEGEALAVMDAILSPDTMSILSISGGPPGMFEETEPLAGTAPRGNPGVPPVIGFGNEQGVGAFRLRLWNQATGDEIRNFSGHTQEVLCAAFSTDGRRAISGSADHTVRLWDVKSGAELASFSGHGIGVNRVTFSADGRRALSGDMEGVVKLWQLPD